MNIGRTLVIFAVVVALVVIAAVLLSGVESPFEQLSSAVGS